MLLRMMRLWQEAYERGSGLSYLLMSASHAARVRWRAPASDAAHWGDIWRTLKRGCNDFVADGTAALADMIQSNLNPGQMMRARPMSASLRTPRGNPSAPPERTRDGQAIPRLAPRPEEAPPGEDEPWLFAFPRCLTTADLWKMGFAQAIMFNAAGWTNEAVAAAEISSALRRAVPLPSLSAEHREDVEGAIAPSFIGGDVVICVACHGLDNLSPRDRESCVACMAVRPHPHPRPHPRPRPRPHPHAT